MTTRIPERFAQVWRRRPGSVALAALLSLAAGGLGWAIAHHPLGALPMAAAQAAGPVTAAAIAAPSAFRLADDLLPPPAGSPKPALRGSPEARLIGIYREIAERRFDQALAEADALVGDHPIFRLAQLVRADLLAARAAPLRDFGGLAAQADGADLAKLREEALARLRALRERPPAGALPAEFVRLPASMPYAIAVDTSRSRLYLFSNDSGGLKLVDDFYVSIGRLGADKLVEGDQKTPLGVYFITDRLDAKVLEDRFGTSALPLNYPNAHDKALGRTGSGILLHGVPNDTYSRPPLDSDGCVVLANEDLQRIARLLPQRDTPVVITRKLEWVAPAQRAAAPSLALLDRIEGWQRARTQQDEAALAVYYGPGAAPDTARPARAGAPANAGAKAAGAVSDWSVITWSESAGTMVVTYREPPRSKRVQGRLMLQYWSLADGRWRIQSESRAR